MPQLLTKLKRALFLSLCLTPALTLTTPTQALLPEAPSPRTVARPYDTFGGTKLKPHRWTSFMTSRAADGWRWAFPLADGTWMPESYSAIGAPGSNNAEYYTPGGVRVRGELRLVKTRSKHYAGYGYRSGVVTTYGKRELKRGTLTVRAKMPDMRRGAWPAIWLLPSHSAAMSGNGDRNEIDLFEGGFLPGAVGLPAGTSVNRIMASHYHEGVWPHAQQQQGARVVPNLAKGFHNYTVKYQPGRFIRTYLDGRLVANFTKGVGRDPYFLILNNAHASTATADWHTVGTEKRSVMRVKWVRFSR